MRQHVRSVRRWRGRLYSGCAAYLLGTLLASGCAEELPSEWLIADTRLLGAKVTVADAAADESERAWPKPGEEGSVSVWVVNPSVDFNSERLQSMAMTCTQAPFGNEQPFCLELLEGLSSSDESAEPIGEIGEWFEGGERLSCGELTALQKQAPDVFASLPIHLNCADGQPFFPFTIETEVRSEEKLLLGVTCDKGKAYLDPNEPALFDCDLSQGGRKELWTLTIPLQTGDESNLHPILSGVFLEGKSWAVADESDKEPCADQVAQGQLPEIKSDQSEVRIGFTARLFEKYNVDGESEREQLWVAHYTTAGEFFRAKSVLRKENERVEVVWTPPEEVPEKGMLVRFFFTLRDLRGGFDSTERALCVTKGKKR